jgi:hypothetical protein
VRCDAQAASPGAHGRDVGPRVGHRVVAFAGRQVVGTVVAVSGQSWQSQWVSVFAFGADRGCESRQGIKYLSHCSDVVCDLVCIVTVNLREKVT